MTTPRTASARSRPGQTGGNAPCLTSGTGRRRRTSSARGGYGRGSGTELSAARFDAILPDSLLVRNLNDTDYIQIILDGADTLARRFSRIDPALVRQSLREARNADSAFSKPRKAGKVLRQPSTPRRLAKSILEHCIERLTDELKSA